MAGFGPILYSTVKFSEAIFLSKHINVQYGGAQYIVSAMYVDYLTICRSFRDNCIVKHQLIKKSIMVVRPQALSRLNHNMKLATAGNA